MNQYIKKNINQIITIYLLLSPILDILTGINIHYHIFPITIGIIIRFLFLISIIYITLFTYKKKNIIPFLIIIIIYSILYLTGIIIYKDNYLFKELQGLIKVFYFPILLISIYTLKDEIRISKLVLFTVLFTYLIMIFVPLLLGVGYKSYKITKAGTLGFFNSANEISGIISILTPILIYILIKAKRLIPKILLLIMYLTVILMMGTKTPLLVFSITLILTFIYYFITWFKSHEYKKILLSTIISLIGVIAMIIIIPNTNFYKNIKTHLKFLKVNDITEVFEKEELFDHFIFSQRLTFLKNKAKIYHKSNTYQKLIGIGYYSNNKEIKAIEIDYLDIYYSHGLMGFIIFFSTFIYIVFMLLRNRKTFNLELYLSLISIFWIIVLSFFTGHIITSPAVSTISIIVLISISKSNKKYILIIYNKLNELKSFKKKVKFNTNYLIKYQDSYKILFIWYKLVNYEVYDLSISLSRKINTELLEISSDNTAVYIEDNNIDNINTTWILTDKKIKSKKNNIIYLNNLNKIV